MTRMLVPEEVETPVCGIAMGTRESEQGFGPNLFRDHAQLASCK